MDIFSISEKRFLLFKMGADSYALSTEHVEWVTPFHRVTYVVPPRAQDGTKYVAEVNGRLFSVIESFKAAPVTDYNDSDKFVIIADSMGQKIGLLASEVDFSTVQPQEIFEDSVTHKKVIMSGDNAYAVIDLSRALKGISSDQ